LFFHYYLERFGTVSRDRHGSGFNIPIANNNGGQFGQILVIHAKAIPENNLPVNPIAGLTGNDAER
jgi:hypothetical protein